MATSYAKSLRVVADQPAVKAAESTLGGSDFDIRRFLGAVLRHRLLLAGSAILVVTLAVLYLVQTIPTYTARAYVMIDTRKTKVTNVEAVLSGVTNDIGTLQSEIEILRSRTLAGRVVDRLNLVTDPELNATVGKPKGGILPSEWWKDAFGPDWLRALGLTEKEAPLLEQQARERERTRVIDAFLRHLSVSSVGRSYVIAVNFVSVNPNKAAIIANTLADLYIVDQLEAKFEATKRASQWLNERLADMRKQVEITEKAVSAYRNLHGLVETKDSTVAGQQLNEINTQLTLARAQRAEKDANLRQIQDLLRSPNGVDTAAQVLSSALISRLREQETEVLRKEAELSSRYGDKHPNMIKVRAEIRDLRAKIQEEVQKIAKSLANEVDVSRAREQSLQASLNTLEKQTGEINRAQVELRQLQREADANRLLYENFLSRFKETSEQQDFQQADARLISKAEIPQIPSWPRPFLVLGLAVVGGLVLGLALVAVAERLDNGIRSADQVEQLTGAPTLALLPSLRRTGAKLKSPEDYIVEKPQSGYGEAIRSLRTALMLSNVDRPPKLVLVTSAVPGEGKSALATSLARLVAQSGQKSKVILVDCDLRRPRVAKSLGLDGSNGLVDMLIGRKSLEEVVQVDPKSGLHVLPVRPGTPNPIDLLGSEQMSNLLMALSKHYDLVVIDSPPVLAVSDARVLSRMVDVVVYLIRWERTPRDAAVAGFKLLTDIGAKVGIALSQVNTRKRIGYYYGNGGYHHYGKYRHYYTE